MTDAKTPYVGYMNPPQHARFKKGKSGNPRGRPRKREGLNTVLHRVLDRKVSIKNEERTIPIRDALIRKLRELALQGDKQALALQRQMLTDAGYDEPTETSQDERDKVLKKAADALRERMLARENANDA